MGIKGAPIRALAIWSPVGNAGRGIWTAMAVVSPLTIPKRQEKREPVLALLKCIHGRAITQEPQLVIYFFPV